MSLLSVSFYLSCYMQLFHILSFSLSFSDPFSLFKGERASPAPLCFTLANCMYVRIVDWCTCPLACQFVVSVVDRWIMRVGACGESVYVRANWTKTPAVKTTRCTILYCPCSIFWLAWIEWAFMFLITVVQATLPITIQKFLLTKNP